VWDRGGIIAIENGVSAPRVVRFTLDASGSRFVRADVIDRSLLVADEPTIGTIVGNEFVYVANSQWEKRGDDGTPRSGVKLTPPVLLAVPLLARTRARRARGVSKAHAFCTARRRGLPARPHARDARRSSLSTRTIRR
jgi:hypothetical protein